MQLVSVVTLDSRVGRPDPPPELTDEQVKEWRRLVAAMPRNWFRPESFPVLVAYCRHFDQANVLSRVGKELQAKGLDTDGAMDRFIEIHKAQVRATYAMLACAAKLRLFSHRPRGEKLGMVS